MQNLKVIVKTDKDEYFFGYVFLDEGQRLQDLVNDERKFVPINKHVEKSHSREDVYRVVMLNKDSIWSIEEV